MAKTFNNKVKRYWLADNVDEAFTLDTGGNVMNDVLILKNGQTLIITGDAVWLYESYEAYENRDDAKVLFRQ